MNNKNKYQQNLFQNLLLSIKKRSYGLFFVVILSLIFTGCSNNDSKKNVKVEANGDNVSTKSDKKDKESSGEYAYNHKLNVIDDNYRTYYEVFLYSFCDSNGDGIGDINGLISKLDYINDGDPNTDTDLGYNGIWLMPIMPSDSYHKYDVKDYYGIDKQYGTIDDFKKLVAECDKRGIKLIIDLVLNHSSSANPWFQSAIKSLSIEPCGKEVCTHKELCREHNPYVGYYNFVKGKPADGKYYHATGDWYYEGVFTSNMPDLNLADKGLRAEIEKIMTYWLDLGVGGFRLDAALHYYSNNTEKNNEVLSWLNNFVKSKDPDNYLVAEVWTGFTQFSKYYQSGIDSIFNFAFATQEGIIAQTLNIKGAGNCGKTFADAMLQVQEGIRKNSTTGIDAPFFTNHDTARASGYFSRDPVKTKMAGGMNLMMDGNVFVYYGEELGMSGTGKDENKRAPMYWSTTDTTGMTKGPAGMETVTHNFGTVEDQVKDPLSIYNYYKQAIRLRNENPEIARGDIAIIKDVKDYEIGAITKTYKGSQIVMLYNCGEEPKEVKLSKDTYGYKGIRGYLSATGEEVTLDGETVSLPPYSIVILK